MPGVINLSELAADANGVAKIVLEAVQEMLLRLALQMARDDYEDRRERQRQGIELVKAAGRYTGRKADVVMHDRIAALRGGGHTIADTARLAGCSESQVKRVWALHQQNGRRWHWTTVSAGIAELQAEMTFQSFDGNELFI